MEAQASHPKAALAATPSLSDRWVAAQEITVDLSRAARTAPRLVPSAAPRLLEERIAAAPHTMVLCCIGEPVRTRPDVLVKQQSAIIRQARRLLPAHTKLVVDFSLLTRSATGCWGVLGNSGIHIPLTLDLVTLAAAEASSAGADAVITPGSLFEETSAARRGIDATESNTELYAADHLVHSGASGGERLFIATVLARIASGADACTVALDTPERWLRRARSLIDEPAELRAYFEHEIPDRTTTNDHPGMALRRLRRHPDRYHRRLRAARLALDTRTGFPASGR